MARVVTAAFSPGCRFTQAQGSLWQYDYGTVLHLKGLELPAAVEIHFATVERGGESETRIGTTADGITEVKIPDALLEMAKTQDYNLYAFVYLDDGKSGQTEYKILMTVRARPKPGEEHPDTEKDHPLADAVQAVNAAADRAETAAGNAAESKAAAEDAAEQADKSRVAAEIVAKHVDEAGRTALAGIASAKTDAAETIETAKTGAVKAVDAARETAIKAVADARTAAEQSLSEAKTDGVAAIETAKTEGLQAIDKAKSDIETARSGAIKDIETAKTSGVQAVEAVTAGIEQTKTAAVQAVEAAEDEGVAAVNAAVEAGKTNFVTDESLSISGRAADAKVVGDELAKKADQTELEDVKKRQNILVGSETGSRVYVTDAFEAPLEGLVLYGKSTQVTTTGAQLLTSAVIKGENCGVTLTKKDSVWHLEGTNTADGVRNIRLIEPTEHFKLPAGAYTLSFSEDGVLPVGTNISISKVANPDISSEQIWTGIGNAGLNRPTKFTLDGTEEALSIFVNFPAGKLISCDLYVMLNAGSTALPWEPYTGGKPSPSPDYPQEIQSAGDAGNLSVIVKNPDNEQMQSVPFSTPNGLPGIPVSSGGNYTDSNGQQWICDEIDFGRGVYVQRIGVLMLDDKSKILSMSKWDNNHLDVVQPYRVTNFTMSKRKVICDRLPPEEKGEAWSRDIEMIGGVFIKNGTDFYIDFYIKNQRLGTTKDTNPDDAISAALKWLKENPLSCKYALATPIENPLSETDIAAYRAFTTYGPTTIVETDGAGMKLDYQRDVNIVIKQLTDTIASMTN